MEREKERWLWTCGGEKRREEEGREKIWRRVEGRRGSEQDRSSSREKARLNKAGGGGGWISVSGGS